MRRKILLHAILGSFLVGGVIAGESYCPPAPAKCPIESCPDVGGSIATGYDTDYIYKGVRLARDVFWGDVNYTFDRFKLPVTFGVRHLTALDSIAAFDETKLYGRVQMPERFGFRTTAGVNHYFYPNIRPAAGGIFGDSHTELFVRVERDIFAGITLFYQRIYDSNIPAAWAPFTAVRDRGAWIRTFGASKDIDINDRMTLQLSGGALMSDNYWPFDLSGGARRRSSGWNSYYLQAALPIELNCRTTLTPYIAYNGSPDTWIADGVRSLAVPGGNANDVFYGGISLRVNF